MKEQNHIYRLQSSSSLCFIVNR